MTKYKILVALLLLSSISIASAQQVLPRRQGGTGTSTTPLPGQLLIGNSDGLYSLDYLTAGGNFQITTSSGGITITGFNAGNGISISSLGAISNIGVLSFTTSTAGFILGNSTGTLSIGLNLNNSGSCSAGNAVTNVSATGTINCDPFITSLTNISSTNITASGYLQTATLNATGQSNLQSVSSTNLLATGYLNVSGQSNLASVSSTNILATGYSITNGNATIIGTLRINTSTAPGNNVALFVAGHLEFGGRKPTITACGTDPANTGTDSRGVITVGSGIVTSCTANFSATFTSEPVCVLTINTTAVTGGINAVSSSSVTFSFSATVGGGLIYYHCDV